MSKAPKVTDTVCVYFRPNLVYDIASHLSEANMILNACP
jgi:hypothetical protein